jgi:hypothetical protein
MDGEDWFETSGEGAGRTCMWDGWGWGMGWVDYGGCDGVGERTLLGPTVVRVTTRRGEAGRQGDF